MFQLSEGVVGVDLEGVGAGVGRAERGQGGGVGGGGEVDGVVALDGPAEIRRALGGEGGGAGLAELDRGTATDGHPFWVPELGTWVDATDLRSGEWLQTSAGTYVQITAVERWTSPGATVHNLTVGDTHTYYVVAGSVPVLVHNCGANEDGYLYRGLARGRHSYDAAA